MEQNSQHDRTEIAAAYERDGFYVVPHLLSEVECEELKAEAVRVMEEVAFSTSTVHVGAAVASPLFYRLASDPRIVEVLSQIMPDGVAFMSDKVVYKSGERTFPTPWHYDESYWEGTRPKLSVWIALDDVKADNGALIVLPGSHHREWNFNTGNGTGEGGEFVNTVEVDWDPSEEVICEVPKGGAIFFSDRLLHASCPNTAGTDRYSIISTYHAPAEDEEFDKHFAARHVIVG